MDRACHVQQDLKTKRRPNSLYKNDRKRKSISETSSREENLWTKKFYCLITYKTTFMCRLKKNRVL